MTAVSTDVFKMSGIRGWVSLEKSLGTLPTPEAKEEVPSRHSLESFFENYKLN